MSSKYKQERDISQSGRVYLDWLQNIIQVKRKLWETLVGMKASSTKKNDVEKGTQLEICVHKLIDHTK